MANAINVDQFEEEMAFLKEEGYTAVSFQELIATWKKGRPLPRKPRVHHLRRRVPEQLRAGLPILQKYEMKATIFVIGLSVGVTDYYKDTQYPMTPHFNYEQAKEMGTPAWCPSIDPHLRHAPGGGLRDRGQDPPQRCKLPNETRRSTRPP